MKHGNILNVEWKNIFVYLIYVKLLFIHSFIIENWCYFTDESRIQVAPCGRRSINLISYELVDSLNNVSVRSMMVFPPRFLEQ
jgi:hypothetical protein